MGATTWQPVPGEVKEYILKAFGQRSATAVAADVSFKFHRITSRSAVMGIWRRAGLRVGKDASRELCRVREARKKVERRTGAKRINTPFAGEPEHVTRERKRAQAITAEPPPPSGKVKDFDEIGFGMCRWVFGDITDLQSIRYCGDAVKEGSSYCGYHHRICYNPVGNASKAALKRAEAFA